MKITLFGATGGVGRQVMAKARTAGYEVTADIRSLKALPSDVHVIRTDLASADPATLESAVAGADAVVSAIGAGLRTDVGIAGQGIRAISEAMRTTGVRRIVAISAAPVGTVAVPAVPSRPSMIRATASSCEPCSVRLSNGWLPGSMPTSR
jgi:putative NADH-flavin reductase